MAKRVTLSLLRSYDRARDESLVRAIEMAVDGCVTEPGYSLQFWRDVSLYGLREAVRLLVRSGYCRQDATALAQLLLLRDNAEKML